MSCSPYKSFSDLHSKSQQRLEKWQLNFIQVIKKIRKMPFWTTFGKVLWKFGKYAVAALTGYEVHDAIAQPTIVAVPQPFPFHPVQDDNDDKLNAAELLVMGWSGLALLAAILAVVIIFKCISLVRFKAENWIWNQVSMHSHKLISFCCWVWL